MPEEKTGAERQQLEDAIAGRSPYPLRGPALRGRLAQLLLSDFSATPADKERALALVNEALGSVQSNDPLYPKLLHFKAAAIRQVQGPSIDVIRARSEAVELDREAWRLSYDSAPKEALFFAQEWAEWAWASDFWEEVSDACELAHRALSRIVLRDSSGTDERFKLLVAYVSVGTRGAYAYVQLQRAKDALILLERVASLLSLANAQTWDLERLATEGHADLRDQILQLQQQASELHEQLGLDAFGNITPAERYALAQLDSVVAEVRNLPGYSSFAMPAGWNDIQAAAAETQLVYLTPTDKGCAIILVLPGARETWQVVVPATREEIYAAARGFIQSEFGDQRTDSTGPLVAMLEWLGSHLMGPVKSLLQNHGTKDDTPITIVPFDLLNWLPIHATFVRLPGPVASSFRIHYLFHPREVSYAYSAHVLAECQRRSKRGRPLNALVINNPRPLPAAYDPLIFSDEESDIVLSHFQAVEISGRAATTERVMEELPKAGIVHFSCHGAVDKQMNYAGVLLLANGEELTIHHLFSLPEFSPRLVVLSACRSGSTAIGLPQVTSLVSGFLATGAAAVLGTFWHTDELATLLLMVRFYELWEGGGCTPVAALGGAQEWLMTTCAGELRSRLRPQILLGEAAQTLARTPAEEDPYLHPWYWAGFFIAGA
jgi:CHAT domain-containing protein